MEKGGKKRGHYEKNDFSDEEIYEEIRDEIREIKESRMNEVEQIERIDELYREHKQSKKRRKMMERGNERKAYAYEHKKGDMESESEEEPGEINEEIARKKEKSGSEQQLTTKELSELIKQVTLTRKKLIDFLDNRKFEDLVKGCFVRYKSDTTSKEESYIIAQIIGIKQGTKEYTLTASHRTKILLTLLESNIKIVSLPIEMVSNQAISSIIEINNWISQNSNKIPTERQIKEKLEQHSRLLTEQLSSQEIDKNIESRANAISKGTQEIKSYEDLQNLIDFIQEKIDNYENLVDEERAKRKEGNIELIQGKRKLAEYIEIKKNLLAKKEQYLAENTQQKGDFTTGKEHDKKGKNRGLGLNVRIEEKREDSIREKWRLREILLCTAEGYEKIKMNLLENHTKYDIELDV